MTASPAHHPTAAFHPTWAMYHVILMRSILSSATPLMEPMATILPASAVEKAMIFQ